MLKLFNREGDFTENTEYIFNYIFGEINEGLIFCPYRLCLLGAHVDHQRGRVLGGAINKGISLACSPTEDGSFSLVSLNCEGMKRFSLSTIPEKQNDWADHLRGAAKVLSEKYPLTKGLKAVISGNFPIGGLSSSAAVIIGFLTALCRANGISLEKNELISLAQKAENSYVGVNCGVLDQSCIVLSEKNSLLYMDTLSGEYGILPQSENAAPFALGIFFSGLERSLANSDYNNRVRECIGAAKELKSLAGLPLSGDDRLRDIPESAFNSYADRLSPTHLKRARHFFTENARVEKGKIAWEQGDIKLFDELMTQSGLSSINDYEAGSRELIALTDILTHTDGVYGARFSGAGFKGSCVALLDPNKGEQVREAVEKKYLEAFPQLADKYTSDLCFLTNGVKLKSPPQADLTKKKKSHIM